MSARRVLCECFIYLVCVNPRPTEVIIGAKHFNRGKTRKSVGF